MRWQSQQLREAWTRPLQELGGAGQDINGLTILAKDEHIRPPRRCSRSASCSGVRGDGPMGGLTRSDQSHPEVERSLRAPRRNSSGSSTAPVGLLGSKEAGPSTPEGGAENPRLAEYRLGARDDADRPVDSPKSCSTLGHEEVDIDLFELTTFAWWYCATCRRLRSIFEINVMRCDRARPSACPPRHDPRHLLTTRATNQVDPLVTL